MIYFIQQNKDGPIKVGFTNVDPHRRLDYLQIGCPDELFLLGTADGDEGSERVLHRRLDAHHIRGEWFAPHADVLACITRKSPERIRAKPSENAHPLTLWRFENRHTLRSFCELVSCNQSHLSQIERGLKQPSLSLWHEIYKITGIDAVEFLKAEAPASQEAEAA